jgi:hypothetical protein
VLILGVMALGPGAASDSSLVYPLVGTFCRGLGLILVGIGVWLLAGREGGAEESSGWFSREALVLAAGLVVGVAVVIAGSYLAPGDLPVLPALCRGVGATVAGVALGLLVSGIGPWRSLLRGAVALTLGVAVLIAVANSDSLAAPGLWGLLWKGLGFLLAGVGAGLLVWGGRPAGHPPRWRPHVGRLLSWLLATACLGEFLWVFAYPDWLGGVFSYRLYTIWAVLQALTFLVLSGLLIDRLRALYHPWPVRLVAAGVLVVGLWGFTHWETLSPNEAERHLTPEYAKEVREADKQAAADEEVAKERKNERNKLWFKQSQDRIDAIPEGEGPVVLVAASGGGSRAAIFTALVGLA